MRTSPFIFTSATLCLTLAALAGCKPSSTPPAPATSPGAQAYDIRGIIQALPASKSPHQLLLQTETTKDMESMSMSYDLDANVSMAGLAVGDKVSAHIEVDAKSGAEHITKLQKLPADTALKIPAMARTTAPASATTKPMPGM